MQASLYTFAQHMYYLCKQPQVGLTHFDFHVNRHTLLHYHNTPQLLSINQMQFASFTSLNQLATSTLIMTLQ